MASNDDEFWASLQGLSSRMDPVPVDVLRMAKESLAWREPDVALAQLVTEARIEELAGVRSATQEPELFTFMAGDLTIEVELSTDDGRASLIGQLVPPQTARIKVDHADGPAWIEADALGRFSASGLTRGHLRITCYPNEGGPVQTAWTLI